ncbi:MAG TPA: lytic transglycosylase domain-containing protein [Pseudonocardiaceae bacterium]
MPISLIGGSANVVLASSSSNPNLPPVFSPFAAPVPPQDGASGNSPHDSGLSPALLHNAGDQSALLTAAGPTANLPSGPLGIPGVVLMAYQRAAQTMQATDPSCNLPWWLLAGIGKIESNQAENGEVDAAGNTLRPILGPVLNGTNGSAAIPATPQSYAWTGDPNWQHAVGPMQFLPSTWPQYGGTGNPNNVNDAALAAARYLCNGGRNLADPAQQAQAVFSYNHSNSYVAKVLLWANAYAKGVTQLPETPVPPATLMNQPQPPLNSPTGTPPSGATGTSTTTTTSTSTSTGTSTTTTGPITMTRTPPPPPPPPPPTCTMPPTTTTTTTTTTAPPPTTTTTTTPPLPPCSTTAAAGSTASTTP